MHYEKRALRPRFKNAAIEPKNAAYGPFGLRPRFLRPRFSPRPKTCDYRPVESKAALFEPRPKTRPIAAIKTCNGIEKGKKRQFCHSYKGCDRDILVLTL